MSAGILPRTLMSFRYLERRFQLHEEDRTEKDQRERDVSPIECPDWKVVPGADSSSATTFTILHGVQPDR